MDSYIPWVGGKRALRDVIMACFPTEFTRYIEVFGGAAWVLFHKRPGPFEVYNDFNPLLANLFRCVRDKPEELKAALRYCLNSREDFKIILDLFNRDIDMGDIDRAAKFYQLIRFSYAAGIDSYSCQPHDLWAGFPAIDAANYRLREVIVENKDYAKLIKHYDRPDTFFYLDPPYFGTEKHYHNSNFTKDSHQSLFDALMGVDGFWRLLRRRGIYPRAVQRPRYLHDPSEPTEQHQTAVRGRQRIPGVADRQLRHFGALRKLPARTRTAYAGVIF